MNLQLAPTLSILACAFASCHSTTPALPVIGTVSEPDVTPWESEVQGDLKDELLASLASLWWEHQLERSPTWSTYIGETRYNGMLRDISPEAAERERLALQGFVEHSSDIDKDSLTASERITLELLRENWSVELARIESGIDLASWNINPRGGPQNDFLSLAADQPLSTQAERAQWLQRWSAIDEYLDQHLQNLKRGLAQNRSASQNAVLETIEQLDALLDTPISESPLVTPAAQHSSTFGDKVAFVVENETYPAFERYRDFLRDEYASQARPDARPGVLHVAGGESYYQIAIREHTSLNLSPKTIHKIGLGEVARIRSEMSRLGQKVFNVSDVSSIQDRMRTAADLHFTTADEVRAVAEATLARANAAIGENFGILPKAECVVVPVPEHEAPYTTIAYYRGPAADGSRPGRYYINTFEPITRPRYEAEVLALHEAVPGHHLQIAIAMELTELPIVRRHFSSTAYVEGWALYTERLGDEMGLYSGDLDRLGVLSFDAWRACRLVVDTGIHALGWTREEAIEYMSENTLLARNNIENEVDRYIAWPGQALAYKLGQLEILQLREEAKAALGDSFRLSDFHDRVLENGAVTLEVLRRHIEQWIASEVH